MPATERTQQLRKELDELQNQYASRGGGGGSAAVSTYYDMMRGSALQAGQTSYERFLEQRNQLSAVRGSVAPNRNDIVLLKDGLDMSLFNMMDDAARMRTNLTELGLAIGEGRRANIRETVENAPLPQHLAQQFTDQQRILVEQRRQLEQLRQEKVQAETDQKWLKRENANRYHGWNPGDLQNENEAVPVPPQVLEEAHQLLRQVNSTGEGRELQPPKEAKPAPDGYLLAEFLDVFGFNIKHLYDASWEIQVKDKAGRAIAHGRADGPRSRDGSVGARRLQMTIPAISTEGKLDIELRLVGSTGSAVTTIALEEIPETRQDAKSLRLQAEGEWANEKHDDFGVEACLSVALPKDDCGRGLAQTRVQKHGVTGAARSMFPGPELPPSQNHARDQAADWRRRGCPVEFDDPKLVARAKPVGKPKQGIQIGGRGAGVQIGRSAKTPERQNPEAEEEPEPPSSDRDSRDSFAAFGGWREAAASYAEEPESPYQTNPMLSKRNRAQPKMRRRPSASGLQKPSVLNDSLFAKQEEFTRQLAAFSGPPEVTPAEKSSSSTSKPPILAAFAGEREGYFSGLFGTTEEEAKPKVKLKLRPPSSLKTLTELYIEVRCALEDGKLGTAEVAQDTLELAARISQPGLLESEAPDETEVCQYAGILIDALDAYPGQEVIAIACVDALITVFRSAGRLRSQLGVPMFSAFARASYNFEPSEELEEMHSRLLAGLATTSSPDCVASPKLVDYIIQQLESKMARMPPLMAEHALAVLCAVRSSHRLGTQIRHTLFLLRGFKSDSHLSTRMLVTLAELYEVMKDELLREVASAAAEAGRPSDAPPVDYARVSVFDRGVPEDGSDLRLTMTILDLYPNNRKVSGAAVRAFAAMSKISLKHLQAVMVDELRGLSSSQRRHSSSRSVNVHCAEIVREAALRDASLISKGAVLLVGSAQRAFPQDQEVAQYAVEALRKIASRDEHKNMLLEAVPASELVKLGELHCSNPRIIEPILHLLAIESFDNVKVREELVRCSAVAVPLRALDFAWTDANISAKALECLKRLTFRSRDAVRQVTRAEGIKVIWSVLQRHQKDPVVVREALSALAGVAKHPKSRLQLVNIWNADTLDVLDQILHITGFIVAEDADVLTQAACAIGTLTSYDDEQVQSELRDAVDYELLNQIVLTANVKCPEFVGVQPGQELVQKLFKAALPSELYVSRILTKEGALCVEVPSISSLQDLPDPLEPRAPPQKAGLAAEQVGSDDAFDIFGPLRGLGVGSQDQYGDEPAEEPGLDDTVDEPEAEGAGLLAFLDGGSLY